MITRLQVSVDVRCSSSQRVIITCHNQACSFTVVINRSRAKADFGLWYLNDPTSQCLHGLLQLFCSKSMDLRSHAEKLSRDNIKYSDYALSVLSMEETEADSYAAVQVGVSEWIDRHVGIITDKARTVTVFKDFEVLMPSMDEIRATSGEMFPGLF